MSAMPERVLAYVSVFGTYSQIKDEYHDVECILVPESRLLAAEARVREVEEQASRPVPLDYGRHPITDARRDFIHHALTYPGFVGNRDLFVEAARDLAAEAATLRAERDALKSRLKDLEDTLDTYWVNNVNKLKENLKEMEAERQKWIDHAIHVESTLRKEIDVLRTQLESHNA